jgi:hypothetical protein
MLDTDTGEPEEKTLEHQGETVREFYSALPGPVRVGIEATGSMQWFLELPVLGNSEACIQGARTQVCPDGFHALLPSTTAFQFPAARMGSIAILLSDQVG